jgi:RNA-directed DNA polymerase
VNTGALLPLRDWPTLADAERRVLEMQAKLHQWAGENRERRFTDLYNLVSDPAFLTVAWERVAGNTGARSAGVDGFTAHYIRSLGVAEAFLRDIRDQLKAGTFRPLPVRERMIPKPGSVKKRRLGIPTVADRVAQAALKLVLEPIFEAGFATASYGFRPNRRCQDAIAEIHHFSSRSYEWVLEADIEACFDSINHDALMQRVRWRIGDKRVLALVKAFLKAGILTETGSREDTPSGTPQGGILSPLLANIALSVLDEQYERDWQMDMATTRARETRRNKGNGTWRLVRYADDFVVLVSGSRKHAEAQRQRVEAVLAPMGLRLSEAKTQVVHIDEGLDFLGFHIHRRRKRGTAKRYVYTYPSKKSVMNIRRKIRALTHRSAQPYAATLLRRVNAVLRGWANYFRHGVSNRVFAELAYYTWARVWQWLRRRHRGLNWKAVARRYRTNPADRWAIVADEIELFNPARAVAITRYRYRGARIPSPWTIPTGR